MRSPHGTPVGASVAHVAIKLPKPTTITVKPDPVTVGYTYSNEPRDPTKPPNEILWEVFGLQPGQSVVIRLNKVLERKDRAKLEKTIKDPELIREWTMDPDFVERLVAKDPRRGKLPWKSIFPDADSVPGGFGWEIPAGQQSVSSGPARSKFGDIGEFMIKYDICLYEDGELKTELDPGINLIPDP